MFSSIRISIEVFIHEILVFFHSFFYCRNRKFSHAVVAVTTEVILYFDHILEHCACMRVHMVYFSLVWFGLVVWQSNSITLWISHELRVTVLFQLKQIWEFDVIIPFLKLIDLFSEFEFELNRKNFKFKFPKEINPIWDFALMFDRYTSRIGEILTIFKFFYSHVHEIVC